MNCNGCGVEIDPSEEQINATVDQILETSLDDAHKKGGVCPLCGHSKEVPYSHRKAVLFALLSGCLLISAALAVVFLRSRQTERTAVANEVVARMQLNTDVVRLIGMPITTRSGIAGEVKQDETGWKEAHLTVPVHGPQGNAIAHIVAGRGTGPWTFTTFEVIFEERRKKADLVSGRIVEYDPQAYVEVHTQAAAAPEYTNNMTTPEPRMDGKFPCVFDSIGSNVVSKLGECAIPTAHSESLDRIEADLRYGRFVLRETDLYLDDVFKVPLTRTYNSFEWIAGNPEHAFGKNTNHPYDIAPLGSRNPYTYQVIVLEDGDFLYFDRISKGTSYADAVYQHSETSTNFYKATQSWKGMGWITKLADGSEIHFPESYNAKSLSQGAPTEIIDSHGNHLELHRDGRRNLQEITTPHGHWMRFTYDTLSRITLAQTDKGQWARYSYDTNGMLSDVTLSSGKERHFEYQETRMTAVIDERGKTLVRNWYQSGLLTQQTFPDGIEYSYSYEAEPHHPYLSTATVTLPDSSTKTFSLRSYMPKFVLNQQ